MVPYLRRPLNANVWRQGGWFRGDASDYNAWAKLVNDPKWSYKGFFPYVRMTERYHTSEVDVNEQGYDGPVYTQSTLSTGQDYPLRDQLRSAWEAAGVTKAADANSGFPQGLGEVIENRNDGNVGLLAPCIHWLVLKS